MIELTCLNSENIEFPDTAEAMSDPNGLLAFGGDLSVETLIKAYSQGIFPWFDDDQPILWWSPNPRMILLPQQLHISRSLAKTLRTHPYQVRFDSDFPRVISNCAAPRRNSEGTWITDEMADAYCDLHNAGIAHSVEIWAGGELIGGLYGVALGKVFFGESMFSLRSNCSKIAMASLCQRLSEKDYRLVDCQVSNPHLTSLGAQEISRERFNGLLHDYLSRGVSGDVNDETLFCDKGPWLQ